MLGLAFQTSWVMENLHHKSCILPDPDIFTFDNFEPQVKEFNLENLPATAPASWQEENYAQDAGAPPPPPPEASSALAAATNSGHTGAAEGQGANDTAADHSATARPSVQEESAAAAAGRVQDGAAEAEPYDLCETAEEFPLADRISDPALHEPECVWVVTTTTTISEVGKNRRKYLLMTPGGGYLSCASCMCTMRQG